MATPGSADPSDIVTLPLIEPTCWPSAGVATSTTSNPLMSHFIRLFSLPDDRAPRRARVRTRKKTDGNRGEV